ncbi:uncharacterized protein [Heterodontus francisci]|uniref:uncharacterized protein n=1 Tax=Heterodontus francisci TaxID=7792 RepID=UPI00355B5A0C
MEGHLPPCILDKLPVLLDAGAVCVLSSGDSLDEGHQMLRVKPRKKPRRSVGVIVSGALSKLKTSITPQSDRTSVAPLQQRISPAANTLLTAKRKANDNVSHSPGITPKKRRSVTESTEAESPLEGSSPGVLDSFATVCCQAEGIESPSIFLKPSLEGATVSAGGSKAPPTSSVTGRGSRRAACKPTQRVLPKREASPWRLHHQKKSIGKSLQCFGFNRGKDSKFNLPLNLTSKEVRATCCDLLTPSVAGSLDGSPLAGTNVLLTPVTQRSDPLDRELVNRHELENYASHHLSPHLNFNTLLEAELSKSEGDLLQDSPGLQISPSDSAFKAKKPQQPNVADTSIHSIGSGMAECDQPWRGHNDIFKLDVGSSIGNNISTPYFVQVPHDSSVSICKIVRRSLSLPEAISESKGNKISEEGVEAGFVEDPDIYLKTLGSSIDTSSAAVDENSLNINREHKNLSVPSVEACHPSIEVKGRSKGMNGNSEMTRELPMPFIVLAEEDRVENCALNSLYDTGDRFRSAENCILGFCDPLSHTSEKSSPQPSIMEMARSSVTECIRKLNKLSGKRRSLKHNFLKVPAGSKQTPHQSSGLRFAQHASTLFGKKPEGYKHQEARQPMRRSLSLESALHVCKDLKGLDDDHASKHDVNDTSPETNNPDCSGISDQYLFSRKKYLALHSPQRKMSRLSPVRRPVLEDRRKQMSPDKSDYRDKKKDRNFFCTCSMTGDPQSIVTPMASHFWLVRKVIFCSQILHGTAENYEGNYRNNLCLIALWFYITIFLDTFDQVMLEYWSLGFIT